MTNEEWIAVELIHNRGGHLEIAALDEIPEPSRVKLLGGMK